MFGNRFFGKSYFGDRYFGGTAHVAPPAIVGNSNYVGPNYGYGYGTRPAPRVTKRRQTDYSWIFEGENAVPAKPETAKPEVKIDAAEATALVEAHVAQLVARQDALRERIAHEERRKDKLEAKLLAAEMKAALDIQAQVNAQIEVGRMAEIQRLADEDERAVELLLLAMM